MAEYRYGLFEDYWGVKELKLKVILFFGGWSTISTWDDTEANRKKLNEVAEQLKQKGHLVIEK